MSNTQINNQLSAFTGWKQRQRKTLRQLEPWLKQQGLNTPETHLAIEHASAALNEDSITVAVAGEFSRGKTELINALFFNDYGRRLLPTNAGRTTMCPTEIFEDATDKPYLRLLPIETRALDTSLHNLRGDVTQWLNIPLDLDDPEDLEARLSEITGTRKVSVNEAMRLGLYHSSNSTDQHDSTQLISIPKWRLAQINFRHPLLAQGLRILDTPGLNTVGNEPELTYEMLPGAEAIIFVLGADTGVTRSDLEIWQQYIKRPGSHRKRGIMVVLNKADTLWDELRPNHQVTQAIDNQTQDVARILDVGLNQVFAASAQKALLARINNDDELIKRTGISKVEEYLAKAMVYNRRDLIINEYTEGVRNALERLENIISARQHQNTRQRQSLADLSGQSEAAVHHMLQETRRDKQRYQHSVLAYKESREEFKRQGLTLSEALNLEALDQVIERAHRQMSGAWTTHGLKQGMRILFNDINSRMETIGTQTLSMRRLVRTIYRRFQTDHNFHPAQPMMFSIVKHQVELGLLFQEAEVFRNSTLTTLTEQHFVVRRYFQTIVSRAQKIFAAAREDAQLWLGNALTPLTLEIKEHRGVLSQQVTDLQHAGQSRKTIQHRIGVLKRDGRKLQGQLSSLKNVHNALSNETLPDADGCMKPQLVRSDKSAEPAST